MVENKKPRRTSDFQGVQRAQKLAPRKGRAAEFNLNRTATSSDIKDVLRQLKEKRTGKS